MSINELRSITTFVRTVELGSLSKAATAQQISPQAASKALGQLEQYLGVRLFHRTTRSMSLTEEGLRFFEAAKPSLTSLQQALQAARQTREDLAGPLRIVGPRTVLQPVIGPVLDEYCRLYPEVQPDVQLDDQSCPAAGAQGHDGGKGVGVVGTDIRHRTGDLHTWDFPEREHTRDWLGSDNSETEFREPGRYAGPDSSSKGDYGFEIGMVVHQTDEYEPVARTISRLTEIGGIDTVFDNGNACRRRNLRELVLLPLTANHVAEGRSEELAFQCCECCGSVPGV